MQQYTACLHFATSLRVGGRAARRSCLPGLRRGGGRQAGAAVLSCLVCRCELTAGQVSSTSECVRRSHCAAGRAPTQTRHRTHLSGGRADSIHTATPDTTRQSSLCRVWQAWRWELAVIHDADLAVGVDATEWTERVRATHEIFSGRQLGHHSHVILTVVLRTPRQTVNTDWFPTSIGNESVPIQLTQCWFPEM